MVLNKKGFLSKKLFLQDEKPFVKDLIAHVHLMAGLKLLPQLRLFA
jgi:hypothetical protein